MLILRKTMRRGKNGKMEIVLSVQFLYKPNTALKINYHKPG